MFEIFREPFMIVVLSGAIITAVSCAYLGVFMILKRIVFMGIALSQAAALGVAIGFFAGIDPLAASFVMTMIAIVLFWIPFSERHISREGLLGFAYAFCAALAVILVARNPLAEAKGLSLISGNLLYMDIPDLIILASSGGFVAVLHALFFKEFVFVSFDRETAYAAGVKAGLYDFLLYLTIGVAISLSMRICGVVFVFSSLVIPAVTAILVMGTIGKIFIMSIAVAVLGVIAGLIASCVWDLPSGPAITGMYGIIFFISAGVRAVLRKTIRLG